MGNLKTSIKRIFLKNNSVYNSDGSREKRKNILFAFLGLFFIIILFVFIRGRYQLTRTLISEINDFNIENNNLKLKILNLTSILNSTEIEVTEIKRELITFKGDLDFCKNQETQSSAQINQLGTDLSFCDSEKKDFLNTIKNSVRAVCCSFNDIQEGKELNWSISGNQIICSGEFSVDCGNGKTNYPDE